MQFWAFLSHLHSGPGRPSSCAVHPPFGIWTSTRGVTQRKMEMLTKLLSAAAIASALAIAPALAQNQPPAQTNTPATKTQTTPAPDVKPTKASATSHARH